MPTRIDVPAKVELAEKTGELYKVKIKGYSGNAVSLTDYGVDDPVVYNIAGINIKNKVPYLLNHKTPLGHTENVTKTATHVNAEAVHSYPSPQSREIAESIENQMPYQASMGLDLDLESVTYHQQGSVEVNGKVFNAPIYVVHKSTLSELSVCLFGRDSETEVVKNAKKEAFMSVKNAAPVVEDKTPVTPPLPPSPENSPVVPPVVTPPETPAPVVPTPVPPVVDNAWLFDYIEYPELVKNARKENWNKDRMDREVELAKIDKSYPTVPGVFIPNNKVENALAARLAHSLGLPEKKLGEKFGEKAAEHALSQGRIGLKETLMMIANAEGGSFNGHSDVENMCKFLRTRVTNTGFSTIDFPNLMHRISQYRMEAAWEIDAPFAPSMLKVVENKDFKGTGHIRPSGGKMWEGFNDEGKIRHGVFGEETTYETRLATVAQILTFKREDIINDDIGLIEELMQLMVEGAIMVPDYQLVRKIYQGKTANEGFYAAGKQLDLELSETALATAYDLVKRRTVPKGDKTVNARTNTRWALVVAPELERTAWEILNQQQFVSNTTADTKQGARNYWYQKFDLKVFDQLDNTTYHAEAIPNAWGLMPVRTQYSPFAISYLNGRRRPTTEIVDMPADMLGFGIRGWFDVNIDFVEADATVWSFPAQV